MGCRSSYPSPGGAKQSKKKARLALLQSTVAKQQIKVRRGPSHDPPGVPPRVPNQPTAGGRSGSSRQKHSAPPRAAGAAAAHPLPARVQAVDWLQRRRQSRGPPRLCRCEHQAEQEGSKGSQGSRCGKGSTPGVEQPLVFSQSRAVAHALKQPLWSEARAGAGTCEPATTPCPPTARLRAMLLRATPVVATLGRPPCHRAFCGSSK